MLADEVDLLTWLPCAKGASLQFFLMMDIGKNVEAINSTLAKTIWKGNYPSKGEFFL